MLGFKRWFGERHQQPELSARDIITQALGEQEAGQYFAQTEELGKKLDEKFQKLCNFPELHSSIITDLKDYNGFKRISESIFTKDYQMVEGAERVAAIRKHADDAVRFLSKMNAKADEMLSVAEGQQEPGIAKGKSAAD